MPSKPVRTAIALALTGALFAPVARGESDAPFTPYRRPPVRRVASLERSEMKVHASFKRRRAQSQPLFNLHVSPVTPIAGYWNVGIDARLGSFGTVGPVAVFGNMPNTGNLQEQVRSAGLRGSIFLTGGHDWRGLYLATTTMYQQSKFTIPGATANANYINEQVVLGFQYTFSFGFSLQAGVGGHALFGPTSLPVAGQGTIAVESAKIGPATEINLGWAF